MNERQFVQALLAQFSRGEGLNLITDPRETDSPVTSGGRRLYDLIDEAFNQLNIEQLIEDVGLDEIWEKYPAFAEMIVKTREDLEPDHVRGEKQILEDAEEELPEMKQSEDEAAPNSVLSDALARMFENKHHKKLDRPYEESIYVPRKEDSYTDIAREESKPEELFSGQKREDSDYIRAEDQNKDPLIKAKSDIYGKTLVSSERELVTGHNYSEEGKPTQPESLKSSRVFEVTSEEEENLESFRPIRESEDNGKLYVNKDQNRIPKPTSAIDRKKERSAEGRTGDPTQDTKEGHDNPERDRSVSGENSKNFISDSRKSEAENKYSSSEPFSKQDIQPEHYESQIEEGKHKSQEEQSRYDDYVVRKRKSDSAVERVFDQEKDQSRSSLTVESPQTRLEEKYDDIYGGQIDIISPNYSSGNIEAGMSFPKEQNIAASVEKTTAEPTREERIKTEDTSHILQSKYGKESEVSEQKYNSNLGDLAAAAANPAMTVQKTEDVFQKEEKKQDQLSEKYVLGDSNSNSAFEGTSYKENPPVKVTKGESELHTSEIDSSRIFQSKYEQEQAIFEEKDNSNLGALAAAAAIPAMATQKITDVFQKDEEKQELSHSKYSSDKLNLNDISENFSHKELITDGTFKEGMGFPSAENAFDKPIESIRRDIGITGIRTGGTIRINEDGKSKIYAINQDNAITMNGSRIHIYDSGDGKVFIGWKGVDIQGGKANIGGTEYELSSDGKINYAGSVFDSSIDTSQSYIPEALPNIGSMNYFTPDFTKSRTVNIGLTGTRNGNTITLNINGEERSIVVRSDGTASLNGIRVHVYNEGNGKVFVGWKNAAYKDGQVLLDNRKVDFSEGGKDFIFGGISFDHSFSKSADTGGGGEHQFSDTFHISVSKSIDFDPVTGKGYEDFFRSEKGTFAFKDFSHKYSVKKIESIVRSAGIYGILGEQGKLLKKEFGKQYIQTLHDVSWSRRTVDIMVENYDKILSVNGDARIMAFYRSKLRRNWVDMELMHELTQAKNNVIALNLTTNAAKLSEMLKGNVLTESQKQAVQEYLSLVYKSREQVIRKGILGGRGTEKYGNVELGFFHAAMPIILREYNLPSDISSLKKLIEKEIILRAGGTPHLTDEQFDLAKNFLSLQKSRKRYQAAAARRRARKQRRKNIVRSATNYVRRYMGSNYNVQGAFLMIGIGKIPIRIVKTIMKTPKRIIKAGRMLDASVHMVKTAGKTVGVAYRTGKTAFRTGMVAGSYIRKHGMKAARKATVRGVKKASTRLGRKLSNVSFRSIQNGIRTAAKTAVKTVIIIMKTVITAIGSVIAGIVSPVIIILVVILVIVFIIFAYINFDSGEVYYDAGDASHDQVIQQCVDVLTECHATFREQLQELYGGSSGNPVAPGSGSGSGSYEDGSNFASGSDPFIGAPQLRQGDSVPVNRVYGTHAGCWWNYEMSWQKWNPASSSNQRTLVNYLNSHHTISRSKTGENYAMVDQKYFLAASTLYWGNVGDILKIEFDGTYNINGENTNTLYIIIADIKAYEHTGYPGDPLGLYGHPLGGNRDLAEFFSYDPLSDNSVINLNNKIGNPVTVTNMGSIMNGASVGGSDSQVMKENPILKVLRGYQEHLESDIASGIKWTYSNHNTAQQFNGAVGSNNRKTNCALLARWALRDAGLISNDTFFYGGGDGEIRWRNNGSKEAVESVCDIISVKGRTINELINSGTLQAGDIVTYQNMQHTNIYAGDHKWYDAGHAYCSGSGEGAVFRSWYGDTVYGSNPAAYIIRVKDQYFTNSLGGGKNILADIVYLQDINQEVYRPLLNPQKNIYILNPEEITDLPDGISPTPTPTPTPVPAYSEGDTVTIDGEQYEVKDQEFANAEGTVSFYNNNQEIISMIIAMFDFDVSISTDLKETIYALKDAQNSEEAKSSFEEGKTSKITDDTWRLISYLEEHGLDMTTYTEGGYDALMNSVIVALFNATHVVTDTTVTEYHDGMMYEVPVMDPEGGYLMDEYGEYVYETIVVPCPGHSKKSAAVTTIFFDDIFDLKTWWNKNIYTKDAFKKENPDYEEKDHILKRDFQLINKPDVDKRIGGYCYGLPTYSNSSFESVEISDAETKQNMQKIYDFAISPSGLRLSKECAAGLMANMYAESKFNPQIVEIATGEGYGLIQWSFDRKSQLSAWCSANGYNHTTLEGQLAFLKHEFDTGSGWVASVSGFRACSTPEDAAEYFCRYNEQPGDIEEAVSLRRDQASYYWQKIQSGGPNWALQ